MTNSKFNKIIQLISFLRLKGEKYSYGTSEKTRHNIDFYGTRAYPTKLYNKLQYLYPLNRLDRNYNSYYLGTYYNWLKSHETQTDNFFNKDYLHHQYTIRYTEADQINSPTKLNQYHGSFLKNYTKDDFWASDKDFTELYYNWNLWETLPERNGVALRLEALDRHRKFLLKLENLEKRPDLGSLDTFPITEEIKEVTLMRPEKSTVGLRGLTPKLHKGFPETAQSNGIAEVKVSDRYADIQKLRSWLIKYNEHREARNLRMSEHDKKFKKPFFIVLFCK